MRLDLSLGNTRAVTKGEQAQSMNPKVGIRWYSSLQYFDVVQKSIGSFTKVSVYVDQLHALFGLKFISSS